MCLNVDVSVLSTTLNVSVEYNPLELSLELVLQLKPIIGVHISTTSSRLKVSYGILCSATNESYLQVIPNIVWLTPDTIGEEFDIFSNVVWKID